MSWGQSLRGRASAERGSEERSGIKVAPIVGKMPWVKGTVGASNGSVRKSKFGPPVDQAIPPPSMLTSQPTLVGGAPPVPGQHQDWGAPPGIRTDWATMPPFQPPPLVAPPPMPHWGDHQPEDPKYGKEETPPPPAPPVPAHPPKPSRNPKPSAPLDMTAMLAAAQQHMQKALAIKCQSIGVPVPEHFRQQAGLTNEVTQFELPEAIPLPGDSHGMDMDIADIVMPGEGPDIPLPAELVPHGHAKHTGDIPGDPGGLDDIAAPEEDISAPGDDTLPPGEEDCRPPGED